MWRRTLLAAALTAPALAWSADDSQVWSAWITWFRSRSSIPTFRELVTSYRNVLAQQGLTPSEIDRRIEVIQRRIAEDRGEWARIAYNRIYASKDSGNNQQPNAFLVRMVQGIKPGKALDFGIGQGRNSVYLAQHGWDVTGFDVSDEGVAAARLNAERAGVRMNAVVANAYDFDWGENRWDLIVATYEDEISFAASIVKALRRGGLFVTEDYMFDPAQRTGPKPSTAVGPNDLLDKYRTLRVLYYEDVDDVSDFGNRRKTRLVRFAGQKV